MAKRKVKKVVNSNGTSGVVSTHNPQNGNGAKEYTFSSGITVPISPFPAGLWDSIVSRGLQDFPDPPTPEDPDDSEYQAEKKKAEAERTTLLLQAVLDICFQLDLVPWEPKIKRMETYSQPFPVDPDERRVEFLTRYVIRTKDDYENMMIKVLEQVLADNPEAAEKIQSFQTETGAAAAALMDEANS